jgi:hypothetical protein
MVPLLVHGNGGLPPLLVEVMTEMLASGAQSL